MRKVTTGLLASALAAVMCWPAQAQSMDEIASTFGAAGSVVRVAEVLHACNSLSRAVARSKDLVRFAADPASDIAEYQSGDRHRTTIPSIASASRQNRNCFVGLANVLGVDWETVIDLYGIGDDCDCR